MQSKHKVSFIVLKVVAGNISNITYFILQGLGIGLSTKFHSTFRLTLVSFKQLATVVSEIHSLAPAQKMCVGSGEAP